uniref:Myozenin 3 n=1 Tax=Varanus komodoensis TaxID=61221 RepID=A0A8D2J3E2_VARKO
LIPSEYRGAHLWVDTHGFLDLGKKVSVPQDLMMEELSLPINRGSRLYQQRQKRVQRFVLEHPTGYRAVSRLGRSPGEALGKQAQDGHTLAPVRSSTLADDWGYAGPLKEVPPEKFNRTAIPKGYQSPWQEFLSHEDYQRDRENQSPSGCRTPTPFGGLLLNDVFLGFPDMAEAQTDAMNSLEILSRRPNFNRAPRGWILVMPESEDL